MIWISAPATASSATCKQLPFLLLMCAGSMSCVSSFLSSWPLSWLSLSFSSDSLLSDSLFSALASSLSSSSSTLTFSSLSFFSSFSSVCFLSAFSSFSADSWCPEESSAPSWEAWYLSHATLALKYSSLSSAEQSSLPERMPETTPSLRCRVCVPSESTTLMKHTSVRPGLLRALPQVHAPHSTTSLHFLLHMSLLGMCGMVKSIDLVQ
mmetsp:Transcript_121287/g.302686  ORF Transcript_121287/g.302686 Transcript_121287/m.302686 type:complete len:209 (+) Transcript_121287:1216-1842(+)